MGGSPCVCPTGSSSVYVCKDYIYKRKNPRFPFVDSKVFGFLSDMTVTGGLISWGAICVTYLRFRKACIENRLDLVPAAKSPLQPFLAWYGLTWVSVLSIFLFDNR
jgi:amino acid permease